jgi:hypothetical protein
MRLAASVPHLLPHVEPGLERATETGVTSKTLCLDVSDLLALARPCRIDFASLLIETTSVRLISPEQPGSPKLTKGVQKIPPYA